MCRYCELQTTNAGLLVMEKSWNFIVLQVQDFLRIHYPGLNGSQLAKLEKSIPLNSHCREIYWVEAVSLKIPIILSELQFL